LIGGILLCLSLIAILVVELYVRGTLECKYFKVGRYKFSPTFLLVLPIVAILFYFPYTIVECNLDISNASYETYIGDCTYEGKTIKLEGQGLSIYVGKYNEIVPSGKNYGKCIYSRRSKVIVYWESLNSGS
jgi:hypothetical protein